jgi:MFS family permease
MMRIRREAVRGENDLADATRYDTPDPSGVLLLYTARAARGFGDGFAVILLPAYLAAIGFTPVAIGFIATAALLGTALLTLAVGWFAPRHDLRRLLLAGAGLMVVTGIAFPMLHHVAFVALIAFFGTINPSSGDIGVLVPLEHAMLAHGVSDAERTRTFARYSLIGALSMAVGSLAAAVPDVLVPLGLSRMNAFTLMFCLYAALGVVSALLYRRLPRAEMTERAPSAPLGPSKGVVYRLAALFCVDSFAGGFAVQSLIALWLFQRFGLSLSAASVFFFWSTLLAAFSFPAAAWLAKRVGLINTMVFTHIPSSLVLIAAAFSPDLILTLGLLLIRAALSQMDVPTRTSYVMAVVTPAERPAAASVTAVPRSLASGIGPVFAGALLALPFSGLPFIICGGLKIAYDLALLWAFRHIKPPEEQATDGAPRLAQTR